MFRIVEDRVFTPRQEGRRKRNIVKFARAGFGCQIHLESRSGQHLVRMQSLYEEHACLVAAGIDSSIKARNCNKGLAWKVLRHRFISPLLVMDRIFKRERGGSNSENYEISVEILRGRRAANPPDPGRSPTVNGASIMSAPFTVWRSAFHSTFAAQDRTERFFRFNARIRSPPPPPRATRARVL